MNIEQQRAIHLDARVMSDIHVRNALLARALYEVCTEAELTCQLSMPIISRQYVEDEGIQSTFEVKIPVLTSQERNAWYVIQTHQTLAMNKYGPLPRYLLQVQRREVINDKDGRVHARQDYLDERGVFKPVRQALTALGVLVTADSIKMRKHNQSRSTGNHP